MKECTKCNQILDLTCYYYTKTTKVYSAKCRQCTSKKKSGGEVQVRVKCTKGYRFCYMCKKEKLTEDFTKTGKQCKDCVCIKNKKYQKENRESINKTNRRYNKERAKVDVNFKLAKLLRTRFYNALKKNHKSGLAIRELGCSIEELKIYLASKFTKGMSWDNHGKWHIDHIKPLSLFDLSNMHELKKAVHYTNLQPLWAEDNYKKNDTYIEEEEICVKN